MMVGDESLVNLHHLVKLTSKLREPLSSDQKPLEVRALLNLKVTCLFQISVAISLICERK